MSDTPGAQAPNPWTHDPATGMWRHPLGTSVEAALVTADKVILFPDGCVWLTGHGEPGPPPELPEPPEGWSWEGGLLVLDRLDYMAGVKPDDIDRAVSLLMHHTSLARDMGALVTWMCESDAALDISDATFDLLDLLGLVEHVNAPTEVTP